MRVLIADDDRFQRSLLETLSAQREAFGLDRLIQSISESGGGIVERLRALRLNLDAFGRGEPRRDDVTFVGLEVD